MTLVAEGVEDEATANHLALSGCDASQGYYYARPLPSHDLETWLDQHETKRQSMLASHPSGGAANHEGEIAP
jgi:EAL domain-containing protein (putative c-di-GMP-specific phosphodiesterase class I)